MDNDDDSFEVYVPSQDRLAAAHGVRTKTIQEWLAAKCPEKTSKGYPVIALFRWRIDRLGRGRRPIFDNGKVPTDPKSRKDHFQAELARLKFETATGKLITSEAHERVVNAWSAWFTDALSQIPAAVASRVAGKNVTQAKRVLQKYCKDLRRKAFGEAKG